MKKLKARLEIQLNIYMAKLRMYIQSLSIRQQLTIWYTAVFAILIICSGSIAYKYLEHSLAASQDSTLTLRAQEIATEISYEDHQIILHADLAGEHGAAISNHSIEADIHSNNIIRIVDLQGNVAYQTTIFHDIQLPQESIRQPLAGNEWQGTIHIHTPFDQEVRIYSHALTRHGMPFAILQVGESLAPLHTVLREQAIALLFLAAVTLLLCGLGSYWLAGQAFTPIHRLTSAARQITDGNLHQRVPVPLARDEIYDLAQTLNQMVERLEESFKRQRRFVADASHELRTPVAAIRSKTDIALLDEQTPQESIATLQHINAESERLGHLISDLLALARSDEGQGHLEHETVHLETIVEAVAANAEILAQEKDITLDVQAFGPVIVQGDEARLIQVVMNLLDNALTYTPKGGQITVRTEYRHGEAYITVQDNGEGIAPEHLPHIFERFYRADPARTRHEGSSSGLGLAIVDWVVRAHRGQIKVNSQLGKGSTFIVTLPCTDH